MSTSELPPTTPTNYILKKLDDAMQDLVMMSLGDQLFAEGISSEERSAFICEAEQIVDALGTLLRVHHLVHKDPEDPAPVRLRYIEPRHTCQFCIHGDECD